ncbi:NAD(P)H-binding protein [Deinococcus sp.]|uniref:NmrA family NAD(P)-binding protein n=1 Tax=Deinococcus sp. TaxID=47478 RepID=UPI003CC53299
MLLITTPTGNTGRHVLEAVLEAGETPRVLVRDPARLTPDVRERSEVVRGDLRDPADLKAALDGIEGAFFCVPQSPDPDDMDGYYRSFTVPFAAAAREAGVRRIVAVSGGDGQPGNRGPGVQLHGLEQTLDASGAATRAIRCGYFMEQFLWMMHGMVYGGAFALPVAGDLPLPFVAARDIGANAGRLLLDRTWTGQETAAAHGPERLSCEQAADIASQVLGFPVRFVSVSAEQYAASLTPHGVSAAMGQSLGDMFAAISAGRDMGAPAERELECPTTLHEWMNTVLRPAVDGLKAGA